jgi:hypothetical protein
MWDYDRPVQELPDLLQFYFRRTAQELRDELENNGLEVVLIPAPEPKFSGHMIRAVDSHNPVWYRELYSEYAHFRRDRSLNALNRIIDGFDRPFVCSPFKYDSIYRELIRDILLNGFQTVHGEPIPPESEVQEYLSNETDSDYPELPF